MLKRIYIDNFRTFTNFELELGGLVLLFGENGAGKSALWEAMGNLQALILGEKDAVELFSTETLTLWDSRKEQRFEIDILGNGGLYKYAVVMEHSNSGVHTREETLTFDDKSLINRNRNNDLQNLIKGSMITLQAAFQPNNQKLRWFRDWFKDLLVTWLDPFRMEGHSAEVDTQPEPGLANFASWYRFLQQSRPSDVFRLFGDLKEIFDGFEGLKVEPDRKGRGDLQMDLRPEGSPRYSIDFDELSDGQQVLIGLYTLLRCTFDPGRTIIIDEPENFIALSELNPWLNEVIDAALGEEGPQVILISHHPEFIDHLARECGVVLFRERGGPTRHRRFESKGKLPASEIIARGWDTGSV